MKINKLDYKYKAFVHRIIDTGSFNFKEKLAADLLANTGHTQCVYCQLIET